jgi:hypothetical protein
VTRFILKLARLPISPLARATLLNADYQLSKVYSTISGIAIEPIQLH